MGLVKVTVRNTQQAIEDVTASEIRYKDQLLRGLQNCKNMVSEFFTKWQGLELNDDVAGMATIWVEEGKAAVQSTWMDLEEAAHRLRVKLNRPKDFLDVCSLSEFV